MNGYISKAMLEYALRGNLEKNIFDRILEIDEIKLFQKNKLEELKRDFVMLAKRPPEQALLYIKRSFNYIDYVKKYCENSGLSFDYLYRMFGILETLAEECLTIPDF